MQRKRSMSYTEKKFSGVILRNTRSSGLLKDCCVESVLFMQHKDQSSASYTRTSYLSYSPILPYTHNLK